MIPAVIEKIKVKYALAIPAGTPIVLANKNSQFFLFCTI